MKPKIHNFASPEHETKVLAFHCEGCGYDHAFTVGPQNLANTGNIRPRWNWNGSMEQPTFTPSLLCNGSDPAQRCHSFVTNGRIQFLDDSWHHLKGKTVDLPDWE
jgi:Family of unknown function (DUF6527)